MSNILNFNSYRKENHIIGKKCGTITISVYKEPHSGCSLFYVEPSNPDLVSISRVVETALHLY